MKVITFPGQGTPVALNVFRSYLAERSSAFRAVFWDRGRIDVARTIEQRPADPASIAACSFLLFDLYRRSPKGSAEEILFLGHSLGELGCLGAGNRLFGLPETMEIAHLRNELMVNAAGGRKFELWAISAPRSENLERELQPWLRVADASLANVNSRVQCVVTVPQDPTADRKTTPQWAADLALQVPRCRIQRLENPYNIPFHNREILQSIEEPLLDFMWQKLKSQGLHTSRELEHPIISNLNGKRITGVEEALESFAKSSCNIVNFVACCDTLKSLGVSKAVHIGPGGVIGKLMRRNCKLEKSQEWDAIEDVVKEIGELHASSPLE
ncbi:LAQU0S01e06502g1_1 [Lachancea quebecensis]|uniref:[acyl-carrier-protein] S-malonyltransferase n=1 Tax=Lachancea quebecensis TaxID=1654605 RepID=A0A0P1KMT2_9SACH|nr:LAQU0S01e06502g1_1 [Lachancea quebecensis]